MSDLPTAEDYAAIAEPCGYEDFIQGIKNCYIPFFHGTISVRSEVYKPKDQMIQANFDASVKAGTLSKEEQEKIGKLIGTYETILIKWRACFERYKKDLETYKETDEYVKENILPELKRADELYGEFTDDEIEYKAYTEKLWYELTEEEQRTLSEVSKPLYDDYQDHLKALEKGGEILRRDTYLNEDLSDVASEEEQKIRKSQLLGLLFETAQNEQVQVKKEEKHEQNQ